MNEGSGSPDKPQYVWPKFVVAGVVLGILLAILWMTFAIRHTREQRDSSPFMPEPQPIPKQSTNPAPDKTTSKLPTEFHALLSGGDAQVGRKIFFEKPEANCGKCHRAGGQGGSGPVLDGTRQTREEILESILYPNLHTTTNFETVIVLLKNGSGRAGILRSEDETQLVVNTPEDGPVTIKKTDVQLRQKGASPMPEGLAQLLSQKDLRDLIEFVASLKQ